MSGYILNGKKIKKVGVLSEPNSYQATLTPENMQNGMTAVVKGKIIEGTGKCFEFAEYGLYRIKKLPNGYYGCMFELNKGANTFFISPTGIGDTIVQTAHGVEVGDEPTKIGENVTTSGDVLVAYDDNKIMIFITEIIATNTTLRVFVGKDNEI